MKVTVVGSHLCEDTRNAMYEEVRKNGGIGIPLLVLEDGTKTFDVNEILNRLG